MSNLEQHASNLGAVSISRREVPYRLKSGIESNLFVDLRAAHADTRLLLGTGRLIVSATLNEAYDTVAGTGVDGGLVVNGVRFAGSEEGLDLKGYSTRDDRRGPHAEQDPKNGWGFRRKWLEGRQVLAVEGTLTSGGSLLTLADLIREAGGIVAAAAVVVDRSNGHIGEVAEFLGKHPETAEPLRIHRLFTLDEERGVFVPSVQESP